MTLPTIEEVRHALDGYSKRSLEIPGRHPAGVMLLLFEKNGEQHLLLEKRSNQVEDHKGEISLPGGRREDVDSSLQETALRETHEEVGVLPQDVDVLGELDDFAPLSKYVISPFVGAIPHPYDFVPNEREVAEIVELPLSVLTDESHLRHEVRLSDGHLAGRPAFGYEGHFIWGATAMVLGRFLEIVSRNEYQWTNSHPPISKRS